MRRLLIGLMIATLTLLVACGEEPLTKSEVLEHATEASRELDSYSADVKIETEAMGEEFTIDSASDFTNDPETMYMEMDMGMPGLSMDVEFYKLDEDDEVYMKMLGEWIIIDEEEFDLGSFDQLNEEELEKVDPFIDELEMTEEEDSYVLTLRGEGDDFSALIDTYLDLSIEGIAMDSPEEEELYEDLSFTSLKMEMIIDKESMLIDSQTIQADLEVDGETYSIQVDMSVYNANENEPVELPDEVKDNALRIDDLDESVDFIDEALPLDEIEEIVDYTIPEVTFIPDDYDMIDSYYYLDEELEMVYLIYKNSDLENGFIFTAYPSKEAYGEVYEDEWTETVSINGNEGIVDEIDRGLIYLTWEYEDVFLELIGEGTEMTSELLLEIAESVE